MNPYGVSGDLFRTTADQSANSFSNPTSPSHMGGGWGINASQLTPSYDAPYRPRFNGPSPYASYQKPGFFGAVNQVVSPFSSSPYWGNSIDHNDSAATAIGHNPFDAAARVGQRFVAPAIAYGLAQKIMTGSYGLTSVMSGGAGGWAGGVGRSFGAGLGRGLGMGAMGSGMMGGLGGMVGSTVLPMAVGYAVTSAIDHAVFQPYARMRQISEDMRTNFSGVTFGDAKGNTITGGGLGRHEATDMASRLSSAGSRDQLWSGTQFGAIADMAGKSGLLDGTNSKQLVDRIKGIADQIKLITTISKDPSIQGAIEELSKLRLGGASINGGLGSEAASIYRRIGGHAAVAGTSVQQLMNGVGMQGQYMYQMNGLTPVLGQLAAANAYAGFASARRNGVFSDAQMARLGGEEGATQSLLSGKLAAMQTPYNRMQQMNRYAFGVSAAGVVGTVAAFGAQASKNPMATMGFGILHQGALDSKQERDGWGGAEKDAIDILVSLGKKPGPNGKWDPNEIALVMKDRLGMTDEQIRGYASKRATDVNKDNVRQQLAGQRRTAMETSTSYTEQQNLGSGPLSRFKRDVITQFGKAAAGYNENYFKPVVKFGNSIANAVEGFAHRLGVGDTVQTAGSSIEYSINELAKTTGGNGMDSLTVLQQAKEILAFYADGKEDPARTLGAKINSSKYAALRAALEKGDDSLSWFEKINEIVNTGLSTGTFKAAAVYKSGMTAKDLDAKLGGNAAGIKINLPKNATEKERAQYANIAYDEANAAAKTVADSQSDVDWEGFASTSNSLDSAASKLVEAANKLSEFADKGGSKTNSWFGSGLSESYNKQKSVGKDR